MKVYSNPEALTRLKKQSYDQYVIFSHLRPEDALFETYAYSIDKLLDRLYDEFTDIPFWAENFHKLCMAPEPIVLLHSHELDYIIENKQADFFTIALHSVLIERKQGINFTTEFLN